MANFLRRSGHNDDEPHYWVEQIFEAKAAQFGGVLKRHVNSVLKHASEEQLVSAATQRGFHIKKTLTHYLIFCSSNVTLTEVC